MLALLLLVVAPLQRCAFCFCRRHHSSLGSSGSKALARGAGFGSPPLPSQPTKGMGCCCCSEAGAELWLQAHEWGHQVSGHLQHGSRTPRLWLMVKAGARSIPAQSSLQQREKAYPKPSPTQPSCGAPSQLALFGTAYSPLH